MVEASPRGRPISWLWVFLMIAFFIVGGIGQTNGNGTPVNDYTGQVDDLQLYSNALTANDVSFLFAHPGQPAPEPAALAPVAVAATASLLRRRRA